MRGMEAFAGVDEGDDGEFDDLLVWARRGGRWWCGGGEEGEGRAIGEAVDMSLGANRWGVLWGRWSRRRPRATDRHISRAGCLSLVNLGKG